ncbi:MAG: type II toxin-antitoxin system RelE/ParE family toxin [Alphaproteobacteria bacterium]
MIRSFKNRRTEDFANGERVAKFQAFAPIARRKLVMIEAAVEVYDLASPPGNRLEKLGGTETWSIRINDQWRICFKWKDNAAEEVEITDYH